jgi:hypothetical protein
MLSTIIACVLAIVVPLVVGAALLTYVQNRLSQAAMSQFANSSANRDTSATLFGQLNARLDNITQRLTACETGLANTSSTRIAAEVADLDAAVEKLAALQRKQFGRVWAELQQGGVLKASKDSQQDVETPEMVRARLREAHGLPKIGVVPGAKE